METPIYIKRALPGNQIMGSPRALPGNKLMGSGMKNMSLVKEEHLILDTTEAFEAVFKGQLKFSSWEEFITLFEEFQRLSRTVFKPRSGTCVNYVNERRVTHKIPDKFVYQTVKMICVHFGIPKKRENSKRQHTRYIGLDCEAFVKLSYKKGFMHITDKNLVHSNHDLEASEDGIDSVIRKIRPVTYNDELDLLITTIVDQNKIFEFKKDDIRWRATLFQVQDSDHQLQHMTLRMLKKRVQFLMDKYEANSDGLPPLSNDHMGIILHRLIEAKKTSDQHLPRKRGRKKLTEGGSSPYKARRTLDGQAAESYEDYIKDKSRYLKNRGSGNEDGDDDEMDADGIIEPPEFLERLLEETSGPGTSSEDKDIASFFSYWRTRDEDERKLHRKEMDLRREEMELRKREMELQKARFEFEKKERHQLINLLKDHGQLVTKAKMQAALQDQEQEEAYIMLSEGEIEQLARSGGTHTIHLQQ